MQSLDVISVNLWQILISLINLVLLFFILKRFLFKPINRILSERQAEADALYGEAKLKISAAERSRHEWEQKLAAAESEANKIMENAVAAAHAHESKINAEAHKRAEYIIRSAKAEAELEKEKAAESIKHEIVEASAALAEKLIEREINADDHKRLIDSFIDGMGNENE